MDIYRDVQAIRESAGIPGHEQDNLIYRRLATHLRFRGYDPATECRIIPVAIEAEIVARVAHEFEIGSLHLRES